MQVPTELAIASLGNISFANFWFVAETSITKTMDLGSLYSEVDKKHYPICNLPHRHTTE